MHKKNYQTEMGTICYWCNDWKPGRSTLVFLPGLTADHHLFDRQIRFFESEYNILVWDAPGHGSSRPFRLHFSLMDKACWLHEILEKEGVNRPVLIGQSMGGYVAQCYLEQFPGTVSGFLSIDSAPLKRPYITKAELWLLKKAGFMYRCYPWKRLRIDGPRGCSETRYGQRLMRYFMASYTKEEYCRLAGWGFRILAEAIEADLPYQIDCPVCLVCGEKDKAGSAKRYNKKWAETEGIRIIWIKHAGHNSNTDNPDRVNKIIQRCVRNWTK